MKKQYKFEMQAFLYDNGVPVTKIKSFSEGHTIDEIKSVVEQNLHWKSAKELLDYVPTKKKRTQKKS